MWGVSGITDVFEPRGTEPVDSAPPSRRSREGYLSQQALAFFLSIYLYIYDGVRDHVSALVPLLARNARKTMGNVVNI